MTTSISSSTRSVVPAQPQTTASTSGAASTVEGIRKVIDFSLSAFEAFNPGAKKTLESIRSFVDKAAKGLESSFEPAPAKNQASSKATGKVTPAKQSTYTVKKGDTLSEIGQRLGIPWQQIWQANAGQIKNPNLIYPGQTFVIPNGSSASPSSSGRRMGSSSVSSFAPASPGVPGNEGSWSPNGNGRLQGADTSHYQSDATFAQSIAGRQFSAIKATEGTGYTDPTFRNRWDLLGRKIQDGQMSCRIAYHFMTPGNGTAQANHFLDTLGIHGKLPAGTRLALDWEASALNDPGALRDAANRIHEVTGNWPLIYTSASQVSRAQSAAPNAPLWVAKWSSNIQGNVPFVQYSDGPGYDHDVFNGSVADLRKFAGF